MNALFLAALLLLSTAARAAAVDVSAVKALILDNMEAVGLVGGSVLLIWVLISSYGQIREALGYAPVAQSFDDLYASGEAVEGVDFITSPPAIDWAAESAMAREKHAGSDMTPHYVSDPVAEAAFYANPKEPAWKQDGFSPQNFREDGFSRHNFRDDGFSLDDAKKD